MAIDPAILRAMQAAGASIDVIIAAVEADAAIEAERVDQRRAKDAERQRRHRLSRDVTVTDRDSETEPSPALSPQTPQTHPHPSNKQPRTRKGHRLPDDWQPKLLTGDVARDVARWPEGAINRELARFRDWAGSASGPNAVKTDWDRAWANWLRKAVDDGRYAGSQGRSGNGRSAEPASLLDHLAAKRRQQEEWDRQQAVGASP